MIVSKRTTTRMCMLSRCGWQKKMPHKKVMKIPNRQLEGTAALSTGGGGVFWAKGAKGGIRKNVRKIGAAQ